MAYVVNARAKSANRGSISLPPKSFANEPTPEQVKEIHSEAKRYYQSVHGQSFHPTVDIKIDRVRARP